jgi:hypothetical protein
MTRYRHWCQYLSVFAFSLNFIIVFALIVKRAYWPEKVADSGEFLFVFQLVWKILLCII